MAYSTQRATSDGTLVLLDVAITYFDRSEIAVLYDGVLQNTGWSWVGSTDKKVSFSPAVPLGVEVMLVRTTDLANPRHIFTLGAKFTTESLDEDIRQILHIAQEARENATIEEVFHDLNMHGYKIVNQGPGVVGNDTPNMGQLEAHLAAIEATKDAAAGFAQAAADSAASLDVSGLLVKANNLADVVNKPTALSNLGALPSTAVGVTVQEKLVSNVNIKTVGGESLLGSGNIPVSSSSGVPAGTVIHTAAASAPTGYLKADGAVVSRSTYSDLFAAIGTLYGAGDGSTSFRLPDLRGEFIRCADDGRGVDAGRSVGSAQAGQNASHTHTGNTSTDGSHVHTAPGTWSAEGGSPGFAASVGASVNTNAAGAHAHTFTTASSGGTEARPRNVALLACIKV